MHRIPVSINERICNSKAQNDRKKEYVKNAKQHRTDVLECITNLISSKKNFDDVMLAGYFNEDIDSEEIERFLILNRLTDAFWHVNKADVEVR